MCAYTYTWPTRGQMLAEQISAHHCPPQAALGKALVKALTSDIIATYEQ